MTPQAASIASRDWLLHGADGLILSSSRQKYFSVGSGGRGIRRKGKNQKTGTILKTILGETSSGQSWRRICKDQDLISVQSKLVRCVFRGSKFRQLRYNMICLQCRKIYKYSLTDWCAKYRKLWECVCGCAFKLTFCSLYHVLKFLRLFWVLGGSNCKKKCK